MPAHRTIILLLIAVAIAACLILCAPPAPGENLQPLADKPDDDFVSRPRFVTNYPGFRIGITMPILPTVGT